MLWYFRDCELDTERYELRRAGQAVLLEPKAFKVLAYLVQHHGRAVAKGDLLAAFWPGAAAASYKEYALRNCLIKIRQALGDTRLPAPVIETVRGYGYRFVAPVTALAPAPHDASGAPQEPPAIRSAAALPNAPPLLPEWRQLTVLRCGLAPTVRVERLDPEEFQGVVQAFYTMCEDVIAPFAGYIAHYDSDELLIYFGYPVAYEDAAVRAVRAGLALCAALPQRPLALHRTPELRLALRLSLHTGPVTIDTTREAPARTPTFSGAMLSASKRLQAEASPHTVLLSAATYALVQGYVVCEALPRPQAAPGDGLACYRVLSESPAQSRFEVAAARGLTPLVGREAEMALLHDRWAQGQDGLGQVVLLCGEPGIGKSRLVQELRDHGLGPATTQIVWRCSPYHQHSAFYPCLSRN